MANEKKGYVVLLTIRRGRHGFYGRGRGNNFTAQGRRNDKFRQCVTLQHDSKCTCDNSV